MTTTMLARESMHVRDATPDDNAALLDIAACCPMEGDLTLRVTREPDFFQLDRLEGTQWRVGVADVDGRVVGCVLAAARRAYLHGVEQTTLYAGDLKVHPTMRGSGVADALSQWVLGALADMGGSDAPILLTILGGNRAMERRTMGRGGMPFFEHIATIRAFSIPLLFPRALGRSTHSVMAARLSDIEEMAQLWERVAPARQLAPVFTGDSLTRWIERAPGLDISDYRLARNGSGRLVGFLAWWDQSSFKQLRVLRYSPRLRVVRTMLNGVAGLTRALPLLARAARCTTVRLSTSACRATHRTSSRPSCARATVSFAPLVTRSRRSAWTHVTRSVPRSADSSPSPQR